MQTTVAIITRSKLEVFGCRYAIAKYSPATDKSSIFVERAKIIRNEDVIPKIPIPCIQPDGSLLVGFFLFSFFQNLKAPIWIRTSPISWNGNYLENKLTEVTMPKSSEYCRLAIFG